MSATHYDIFISYAGADHTLVTPFVRYFQTLGLVAFFHRESIASGSWGILIEEALNRATWVVAFLSRNAYNSGYVFAECDRARKQNKLIPLIIDRDPMRFEFDGLTALIQRYSLSPDVDLGIDKQVQQICAVLKGGHPTSQPIGDSHDAMLDRIAPLFAAPALLPHMPYVLALTFFENLSHDEVTANSARLRDILDMKKLSFGSDKQVPTTRRTLLAAIDAEMWQVRPDDEIDIMIDCVHFKDAGQANRILEYVWEECDFLKPAIIDWLTMTVDSSPKNRQLIALKVGLLAQSHFHPIYGQIIGPWAAHESAIHRRVADMALAVAALSPAVAQLVGKKLGEMATDPGNDREVELLLLFACGYTGLRLPDVASTALQGMADLMESSRISQRNRKYLITKSIQALKSFIARVRNTEGETLFDFPGFMHALACRGNEHTLIAQQVRRASMADLLLVSALEEIPLKGGGHKAISLEAMVQQKPPILDALASAIAAMLAEPLLRREISAVLEEWIKYVQTNQKASDVLMQLARLMVRQAYEERDRQRIEFLFRHVYSEQALRDDSIVG